MYSYDERGWLVEGEIAGRTTGIEPPSHGAQVVGQPYPNFTGLGWVMAAYSDPVTTNPLPGLKAQKIAAIRAYFGNMVDALKADAAPYEVETWSVQTAEYSAWMADNATATPYVSALAAARGLTLDALMGKIGAKVAGLATIQGTQHALETAANAATTEAQLQEILA